MNALLLIDLQKDFMPGGPLAVPEADTLIPIVNERLPEFDRVVATQDWHPVDHGSFAVNHPGKEVFDQVDLHGLQQTLWPVHCVQHTDGADFASGLQTDAIHRVFPKGQHREVDSYSGFFDNGHRTATGLAEWLKGEGINEITIAGVATDYCVKFTVLDAVAEGFKVHVFSPACRGVNLQPGDTERAREEMITAGANWISV